MELEELKNTIKELNKGELIMNSPWTTLAFLKAFNDERLKRLKGIVDAEDPMLELNNVFSEEIKLEFTLEYLYQELKNFNI